MFHELKHVNVCCSQSIHHQSRGKFCVQSSNSQQIDCRNLSCHLVMHGSDWGCCRRLLQLAWFQICEIMRKMCHFVVVVSDALFPQINSHSGDAGCHTQWQNLVSVCLIHSTRMCCRLRHSLLAN